MGKPGSLGRPRGILSQRDALQGHTKYRRIRDINSGSYGQVQLAVDRTTNEQVAIKLIERGSKITKYVERELINHSHLLHPHIIQASCPALLWSRLQIQAIAPAYLAPSRTPSGQTRRMLHTQGCTDCLIHDLFLRLETHRVAEKFLGCSWLR